MDLKRLRVNKGLTLIELQEKCGIDFPFLSMIENHKKTLSRGVAVKIAPAFGVSPESLQAAQLEAGLKYSADRLEEVCLPVLKRAMVNDPQRAGVVTKALAGLLENSELEAETRLAIKRALERIVQALEPRDRCDRDIYGRKRSGRKVIRDAVGRVVKP